MSTYDQWYRYVVVPICEPDDREVHGKGFDEFDDARRYALELVSTGQPCTIYEADTVAAPSLNPNMVAEWWTLREEAKEARE